jgi:hypothetical protein
MSTQTSAHPGDWVLWGVHPLYAHGEPIRVEGGTFRTCRGELNRRVKDGGWSRLVILHACEKWSGIPHGQPSHVCAS